MNLSSETGVLTANLKMRDIPALSGNIITILPQDSQINIIARTKFKESIDGLFDYWLQIDSNNTIGWVYAGYVKLEGKSKLFLNEEDVIIIDNHLIQTNTITSQEEFTNRLGDYSRALIRQYLKDLDYEAVKSTLGPFEEQIQTFPQQSRYSDETYNIIVTTLESDNFIAEYYNIENKSKFLSIFTLKTKLLNDPWNLGIGKDLLEYIRIFGIGRKKGKSYTFDVDSLDDWIGYSGVEDLILTLDDDYKILSISVKKYMTID